jgi:hypothetical protein
MAGAKKKSADDAADDLYARAGKDPAVAEILRNVHEGLRLWRRCANKQCRRARACCGDVVACGSQRWPVAMACLQAMKARHGTPLARVADRKGLMGAEPQEIVFKWQDS